VVDTDDESIILTATAPWAIRIRRRHPLDMMLTYICASQWALIFSYLGLYTH